jgi:hypothetical protein
VPAVAAGAAGGDVGMAGKVMRGGGARHYRTPGPGRSATNRLLTRGRLPTLKYRHNFKVFTIYFDFL